MFKKILKMLGYFFVGAAALVVILFFTKKSFSLYPFKYDFMASDLHFFQHCLFYHFSGFIIMHGSNLIIAKLLPISKKHLISIIKTGLNTIGIESGRQMEFLQIHGSIP